MGWASDFVAELGSSSRTPVYRLVVEQVHASSWWSQGYTPPGRSYVVTSAPGYGESTREIRIGDGIRVSGGSISPLNWSVSVGGFTVELCGLIGQFRAMCSRGAIVSLEMGGVGGDVGRFERIALGRYQFTESEGLGAAVRHTATFWGIGAILQNRIAEDYQKSALFGTVDDGTDLSSTYNGTAGTMDVTAASVLERETGGTGVVGVTPTGGSTTYYVKWTNVSTNTLTISPSTELFNTARPSAAGGSSVENVAYLSGHPLDIFTKLLVSGNGSSSSYNKYPTVWGYRLPTYMVGISDIQLWKVALTSSAGYDWEYLVTEPQENGWTWLTSFLSVDGIWPVLRQGEISARYAQNIYSPNISPTFQITESDQIGEYRLTDWDPDHTVEYGRLDVETMDGHTSSAALERTRQTDSALESMPISVVSRLDLTDRIRDNAMGDAVRPVMADRLQNWAFRVPERLSIRCHLYMAALCPGDLVLVSLPSIQGRITETLGGYLSQPCLVASVEVDYTAGTVALELLTHGEAP